MKTFLMAFVFALSALFCCHDVAAQEAPLECTLHVSKFKFKKPRFDCNRGFGLCVNIHWHIPIEVEMGAATCNLVISFEKEEPRIDNKDVYAGMAISKDRLWLVLPASIRQLDDYKKEDLSFLPVEEKIQLFFGDKPYKTILPQKAPVKESGKYLVYEFELTD